MGWVLLILVAVVVLWMIGAYNGLISLKNQTVNAFKQIDVQLKRRHDLIPNLVNALTGALSRLMVVVEQYPQLKATGNIGQLQEELTSTENKVSFARQLYNDTATEYNTKQQQFPTTLVAGLAKAQPADLWEIEDQGERAVPKVDLSSR